MCEIRKQRLLSLLVHVYPYVWLKLAVHPPDGGIL